MAGAVTYNDVLGSVIDQRVAASQGRTTATGTVTYRSRSWYDVTAMVTFDGSALAVPVKVGNAAAVDEGDRVCMQRFGSEWVIVTGFTPRQPFPLHASQSQMAVGSTTSTAWATFPFSVTSYFTKRFDDTRVRGRMFFGAYAATGTVPLMAYGVRATSPAGVITETEIGSYLFNGALRHESLSNSTWLPDAFTPWAAGEYVLQPVWKLKVAGGTVHVDDKDWYSLEIQEQGWA